jgi:type II secretory pathway predicted ATPase ExeA
MTTPANLQTIEGDELVALATRISDWQEQRKYSDNELLRRCPGLGSTKTFTRIVKGDLAELDLDRWLSEYRAVWALIESLSGREQNEEELYDDISTVVHLRRSLVEILECRSIRRVILLESDSGLGKSSALTLLQRKYGQRILIVEATEVWADNPNAFLGSVLDSLGVKEQAMSREGRLRQVTGKLRQNRTALAIDEAHHLGPHCLNTCKTLINQTPCEVILLALPTLWRRLERAAYEEVKQLLGNRLAERIKVGELREGDVKKLLLRRVKVEDGRSAQAMLKEARTRGNLSFVAAVCERISTQEIDGSPAHEAVLAAIEAEKARR